MVYYQIPRSYGLVVLKSHKIIKKATFNLLADNRITTDPLISSKTGKSSMNSQPLEKIVLFHMAEEEAAEEKVKRNSIGCDFKKCIG
jgi:hypothetical protein